MCCDVEVHGLIDRLEDIRKNIRTSNNAREVEALIAEAEMLGVAINGFSPHGDCLARFKRVWDEIF